MSGKSPTTIVIAIVIAAVLIFGGYKIINHFTKPKPQAVVQSPTSSPAVSPVTSASPEAALANEMKINLAEENKSGESGTAVLKEENGKTTVTVNLTGFTKDIVQPAHIHIGACPGVGAVKYPLTNVVNGTSVTVLDKTLAELKTGEPLAINVHKSAAEITSYSACGILQ